MDAHGHADPAEAPIEVPLAGGDSLLLRPETAADAAFLKALFITTSLRQMGIDSADGLEPLLEAQHRSRAAAHAERWPGARRRVVEHDGSPVGTLIEGDAEGAVHVVDIALLPAMQGHGLGAALIADLKARAAARGLDVTADILLGNVASLALFRRSGFVGAARNRDAHIHVRWSR